MFKYLTRAKIYAPLMPPLGDIPDELKYKEVTSFGWGKSDTNEEIRILFTKAIKKYDLVSEENLTEKLNYVVEIAVPSSSISDAAARSVYLLEQSLDTSSLFSQADCKIVELLSIVNLTQIEKIIKINKGSFEKGIFKKHKLTELKAFPPGRLIFLSDTGTKRIGRNLFWFRRGLIEISSINRFVAFFTALKEIGEYLKETESKYKTTSNPVKIFIEEDLKFPKDTFKVWSDLRGEILHFGNKEVDFEELNTKVRTHLGNVYKAAYYGIFKFFSDNPPKPSPLIIFDEIDIEKIDGTEEVIKKLREITLFRKNEFSDITLS